MLGELTHSQIDHVLNSASVGRIGCYANEKIYVVPVTFAFDGKFIYGHSKEGMKIEMMRQNPNVCFEVDIMENMTNWRSVIAWGKFEELKKPEQHRIAMKLLSDKFLPMMVSATLNPWHGRPPEVVEKGIRAIAFRIRITTKTGRYEKNDQLLKQ